METKRIVRKAIIVAVLLLAVSQIACADIVTLDLFSIGCPTSYQSGIYWSSDFDLGVTFSQIDNVYIDWAGEITAGLAVYDSNSDDPFPLDVSINAYLDMPVDAGASVWGGEDTYPAPETFDCKSDLELFGLGDWSGLLDGQSTIWLYYEGLIIIGGGYTNSGSIILDNATLVIDGIIPEPSTFCLLSLGSLWITHKSRRNKFN